MITNKLRPVLGGSGVVLLHKRVQLALSAGGDATGERLGELDVLVDHGAHHGLGERLVRSYRLAISHGVKLHERHALGDALLDSLRNPLLVKEGGQPRIVLCHSAIRESGNGYGSGERNPVPATGGQTEVARVLVNGGLACDGVDETGTTDLHDLSRARFQRVFNQPHDSRRVHHPLVSRLTPRHPVYRDTDVELVPLGSAGVLVILVLQVLQQGHGRTGNSRTLSCHLEQVGVVQTVLGPEPREPTVLSLEVESVGQVEVDTSHLKFGQVHRHLSSCVGHHALLLHLIVEPLE